MKFRLPLMAGAAVALAALSPPAALTARASSSAPRSVLQSLSGQHLPANAVSMTVVDPETGHVIVAMNAATPRSPASTVKVLTTFASLDVLGPAYTWHTRILAHGDIDDGVLKGDLVLQGGGDPFMTLERWWALVRALRVKGLKSIRGDIIIDDSAFARENEDPGAFDGRPHRPYNVIPDALMVNFQNIEFHVEAKSQTRQVDIVADPAPVNLTIDNQVRFVAGRCRGAASRINFDVDSQDPDHVTFAGALSEQCAPRSFGRVMMRPADYAYGTFVDFWHQLGGEFTGKLRVSHVPPEARPYLSFDSLTLSEIVRLTNKFSNNLMARHLLLTMGQERYGTPATTKKGALAIEDWSKSHALSLQDVDIDNGSGLSRETHVTVTELADVLRIAYHSRYAPEFMSSLPLAGIDGTLRSRLRDTPAGAVRLKTGHLNGVSGIAGYVTATSGKTYIVVSLVNDARADNGAGDPVHAALVEWVLRLPAPNESP